MNELKQIIRYHKLLAAGTDDTYHIAMADKPDTDQEARRLHAKIYQERGYVTADGVDHLGIMTPQGDPYGHMARYFGAWINAAGAKELVATGRLIEATASDDHYVFQFVKELELDASVLHTIQQVDPTQCAEVSGLAKRRGESTTAILMLYRAMWQYSVRHHHKLWLMAADENLYAMLQQLFGAALVTAGAPTPFKGHVVVPATLDVGASIGILQQSSRQGTPFQRLLRRRLAAFMLKGLTPGDLNRLASKRDGTL
jgi:hypothetical protein